MRVKSKILNFQLLKNVTLVKEMDLNQVILLPDRCTTCGGNGKVRSNQGFLLFNKLVLNVQEVERKLQTHVMSCNGQGNKQAQKNYLSQYQKGLMMGQE